MAVEDERSADDGRQATVARDCGEPAHYEPAFVAYSGRVARAKGGTRSGCGGARGAALLAGGEHSLDNKVGLLSNIRKSILSFRPSNSPFRVSVPF